MTKAHHQSYGADAAILRKDFSNKWQVAAERLIQTGQLGINPTDYVHILPSESPQDLSYQFANAAASNEENISDIQSDPAESWLLFANSAFLNEPTLPEVNNIIKAVSTHCHAEHLRNEVIVILTIGSAIRCRSENQIEEIVKLFITSFGCNRNQAEASLNLYLKFAIPGKNLSELDRKECLDFEAKIRPLAINRSRAQPFFLLSLLCWLLHDNRWDEYEFFKKNLLSAPSYFTCIAKAFLDYQELINKKTRHLSPLSIEWIKCIRPGITLPTKSKKFTSSRSATETSHNELTLSTPSIYKKDSDICIQRFLASIKNWRSNGLTKNKYGISFITSVYKGGEWLESFLSNMTKLSGFSNCELILINANSPQKEQEIRAIREAQLLHENIIHIILDIDPGLYNIWNIGASIASCDYLSNANLDDRKSLDFIDSHLDAFKDSTEVVSLVSAPCIVCDQKYIGYEEYVATQSPEDMLSFYDSAEYYGYTDFFLDFVGPAGDKRIVWRNIPHCMPVWRRDLHQKYGYFNEERGGPTADLEFWLRCAKNGETYRNLNISKGIYYYSDKTTYSARKEHSMDLIDFHHVTSIETANLSYLSKSLRSTQ